MFLLCNYVGMVKASKYVVDERTLRTIEVTFHDKYLHTPISLDNDRKYELAALNYCGLVLASKGPNNGD
jgi:hypothetical protein